MPIWGKVVTMATILEGVGFILAILGGAAAESQNIMIPAVMIGAGIILMAVGYFEERRFF